MKNITTLDGLKELSIAIDHPIRMFIIRLSKEVTLTPDFLGVLKEKTYENYKGTIAFVSNHTLYVIPYTKKIINLLLSNGFTHKCMFVPFSNGDYPVLEQEHWQKLQVEALAELDEEFRSACEEYADKKGFGSIAEHYFEKCLEIPTDGLPLSSYTQLYSPASTNWYTVPKTIGTYSTFENISVFVYRTGKTYVTPKLEVVEALANAGYIKGNQHVPLALGEIIQDYYYNKKWKELND